MGDAEKALAADMGTEKEDKKAKEGKEKSRGTWSGRLDFLMSALSFAVGLGNVWRFPYLVYRNGGGAFLIPYLIMMLLAGFPLMLIEMAFGQYGRLGVVSIWKAVPLFQGIGWGMFSVSLISSIYYNMVIAWCFYYMFASFSSDVPWRNCDNWWNTEACGALDMTQQNNCTKYNGTWWNNTCYTVAGVGQEMFQKIANWSNYSSADSLRKSPADEYFHRYMLDMSEGFHDMGGPRWQLALCLLFCWLIVAVCLSKGIKSSGKATYVTSTFPYVILIILFVRGITLEGSGRGILYYVTPRWHRLLSAKVWGDAAVQVFFSLSSCWGGIITLASYNEFNNNVVRDALVVASGDCLTSIFGGFVIFSIVGYMSTTLQVPIDKVAKQGASLAFIVYPSAVTKLPVSPLWAILFMLILINFGVGTQFTLVTTVQTTLIDVFPNFLRKGRRSMYLLFVICAVCFLLGLSLTTRGGMYMLQLMDTYSATYALLILALSECIALSWVYGIDRFYKDIENMLGYKIHRAWGWCWKFVTPILIVFIMLSTFIDFKRSTYGEYVFPVGYDVMGWMMSLVSILMVPIVAVYKIVTTHKHGSLRQRIRYLCTPTEDWGAVAKQIMMEQNDIELKPVDEAAVPLGSDEANTREPHGPESPPPAYGDVTA